MSDFNHLIEKIKKHDPKFAKDFKKGYAIFKRKTLVKMRLTEIRQKLKSKA